MTAVVLPPLLQRRTANQSSRHGAHIDLLVWHETAGAYKGSIDWLCNPASDASAHLVVREDGGEVTQLVRLSDKAWHAETFNARSVGVEHANVTAKGYATDAQLRESARIFGWLIAQSPRLFGQQIPPRWARNGNGPGVCYHGELGAAGGGHTACGPDHSGWLRLLDLLRAELKRGGYKRTWAT
jgi:hypothetical protein